MDTITQARQEIDALDVQIIELLGQRFNICRRVAAYKKQEGIPMMQLARIEEIKQRCQVLGEQNGIDREFILGLYSSIIQASCDLEDSIIKAEENP